MPFLKFLIASCYLAFTFCGCIAFQKSWGNALLKSTNATVLDGYFVDRDHKIKFKLPPKSFVYGAYRVFGEYYQNNGRPSRRVSISFEDEHLITGTPRLEVEFEPYSRTAALYDFLASELEQYLKRIKENNYLRDITVEESQVICSESKLKCKSAVRTAYKEPGPYYRETIFISEQHAAIKEDFLIRCSYTNRKMHYNQVAANDLLQGVIDTFSVLSELKPK